MNIESVDNYLKVGEPIFYELLPHDITLEQSDKYNFGIATIRVKQGDQTIIRNGRVEVGLYITPEMKHTKDHLTILLFKISYNNSSLLYQSLILPFGKKHGHFIKNWLDHNPLLIAAVDLPLTLQWGENVPVIHTLRSFTIPAQMHSELSNHIMSQSQQIEQLAYNYNRMAKIERTMSVQDLWANCRILGELEDLLN
ncbi:hypothetical protein [Evansella cellulosilytica]|uniref:Uncharacterized protein n=1 Tax=Evansella cellulosilytica (strain ATCC 21833 / DSM 2522 / FERM P-1141 / JCM 9156 / N-4) TaxID=649639 RepID=E6TUX6_EVAC2|nr:hypothetical protein [Evansella cellulosilytica]ADU32128.1 hypothetical protein Bcell_3889 [Evansella cellulosilytica DSM 2522]